MPQDDEYIEWERNKAAAEADRLRKSEPPPKLDQEEFLAWRSPRTVRDNPTRLDNPLWHWMVRTRWGAWSANERYAGPSSSDAGPMWTFDRLGKSETILPDGRAAHIGGEHEDSYDPDFFIYNDVTLIDPSGNIAIYGYPVEDFPPTDFHSATLVGNEVFIIGRLGYPEGRVAGATPVYRLALASMHIEKIETQGEPPGWIYEHAATLADDGHTIVVRGGQRWHGEKRPTTENIDSWELNTRNGQWRRLTARNWQQWTMRRVDRKRHRLSDIRDEQWYREFGVSHGFKSYWRYDDEPDFASLAMLYRLNEQTPPPTKGPGSVFNSVIDGLTVRFKEDLFWVEAIVEGQLAPERLLALKQETLALLKRLEGAEWEIE